LQALCCLNHTSNPQSFFFKHIVILDLSEF
jgi:hypothetical protein